jgi:hypothetical protein
VTSGVFDIGPYSINNTYTGGFLTINNGATLKIGAQEPFHPIIVPFVHAVKHG